tara:strand:- start:121 stop:240 length:120 start_codon:yes stop_codon:yes gene_type:complete
MKGSISQWFEQFVDDIESPQLRHLLFCIQLELDSRSKEE